MKSIAPILILLITSCSSKTDDSMQSLPGKYVKPIEGVYSKGWDTLTIEQGANNRKFFNVTRHAVYQRYLGTDTIPAEKREHWTCAYDEETNSLSDTRKGKTLLYNAEENIIIIGQSKYEKIKY